MKKAILLALLLIFVANFSKSEEIAERFAPILYFEKGEELYPVSIEYHLLNSNLNRSIDNESIFIKASPSPEEIGEYKDADYYLDNVKGTIYDDRIIEDYKNSKLNYTVYCHVFSKNNLYFVQYWFFYAFNKGYLNTHEGDWEMVQIVLNENKEPIEVMYSQHISGQRASWKLVEKEGEHIKVYVARGSHANYFRYYQGKIGLANDIVGKNGKILYPNEYKLVVLKNESWLYYGGRWGEFGGAEDDIRGKRGPFGPLYREEGRMWNGEWGFDLPALNKNILYFEWFLYHFTKIYIIAIAIGLAIILFSIYGKSRKRGFKFIPFVFNIKENKGNILAISGIIFAILSLFYPWYNVFVNIPTGDYQTPGFVKIVSIDGLNGLQVNLFEKNSGMIQIGALPIPFSVIIGSAILFFILGTIGIKGKKAGIKYIWRGIKFLLPVILIIIAISFIKFFTYQIKELSIKGEAEEIINAISTNPLMGEKILYLEKLGEVHLKWGIGLGSLFLLLSSILLIISGILAIGQRKNQK